MRLSLKGWKQFSARLRRDVLEAYMEDVAKSSAEAFRRGIRGTGNYPPASRPGQWPAIRSGGLLGSIDSEHTATSATVGSNQFYSGFLRNGTRKMARRKMSDNALEEGMRRSRLRRWVEWTR